MEISLDTNNGGKLAAWSVVFTILVNVGILIWNIATFKTEMIHQRELVEDNAANIEALFTNVSSQNSRLVELETRQWSVGRRVEDLTRLHSEVTQYNLEDAGGGPDE